MTPTKPAASSVRDGLDHLAQRLSPPLLNTYFHGQLLSAESLEQAQLQARHAAAMLAGLLAPADAASGGAVLIGLEVTTADAATPPGDPLTLVVAPGVAIDGYGRLVVVPVASAPDGTGNPSGMASISLTNSLPAIPTTPGAAASSVQTFDLVLRHALTAVQESPVLAGDSQENVPDYANSLFRQGYRLELVAPSNPPALPTFAALFPIEPDLTFTAARPAKLIETCHRTVPSMPAGSGSGRSIVSAPGIVLTRVSATVQGSSWKITLNPPASAPRREVFPLATLSQLVLDLAAKVDSTLRRRTLSIVSGNGQTGLPGKALANELIVSVLDANGHACSEADVAFRVTGGNGSLSAPTATSGSDGLVRVSLTLDATEGLNTVEVGIKPTPDLTVSGPVSFVALGQNPSAPPPASVPAPPTKPTPDTSPKPQPSPEPPPEKPPAPQPSGTPALTACAPIGRLDKAHAKAWLKQPELTLTFDRPMNAEDLGLPHEWLRVFRMKSVDFEELKDLAYIGWALNEYDGDYKDISLCKATAIHLTPSPSSTADSATYALSPTDLGDPHDEAVFLVLVNPGQGHPRAVLGGAVLGVGLRATGLTHKEFMLLWNVDHHAPGPWTLPIDWRHLAPRPATSSSTAHGREAGRSHSVFYLGHPHGFDASEEYTP
jgi:hypothetical protein